MRPLSLTAIGVVLAALSPFAQGPPPTFRSSIDVIAVDVQVVDKSGAPVEGLGPAQFQVTIDGKPRRVVTADLVSVDPEASGLSGVTPPAAAPPPRKPAGDEPGRVYILAFDAMSFPALAIEPARDAARAFVNRLLPNDRVGLLVLPQGPAIDPTTDRGQIIFAIERVIGQAKPPSMDPHALMPSEIVDFSRLMENNAPVDWTDPLAEIRRSSPMVAQRLVEICTDPDLSTQRACLRDVLSNGTTMARLEEADVADRLSSLRSTLRFLGGGSQRKIVVLISAGVMSSDQGGGRPNIGDVGRVVGLSAAETNSTIYTLFFDRLRLDQMSASRRNFRSTNAARDSLILSKPLEQIADTSGGSFSRVPQGGGEFAFDRILKETSAYYLLGVQPEAGDRDGRSHQLKVKVGQRDVTVRGRSWVNLPRPGAPPPASSPAPLAASPPPQPLPETIRPVAAAYERREYDAVSQSLSRVPDLANAMRDFRLADPPWPGAPRRGPAFALELALSGLASSNGFARDEGVRLLTQAHAQVERSQDAAFACAWFLAEAAGLENLWQPDLSLPYVTRALGRCTTEPRLHLARGVIVEQLLGEGNDSVRSREIAAAFAEAAKGDTAVEATVRSAWFAVRHGAAQQAVASLQDLTAPSADPYVRYIYAMVQGHALRAVGRVDAADAAYRRALEISPGAQSARVALLTLMLGRGQTEEAEKLAELVQTAGRDQIDPWWTYARGDGRIFPAILARLRELVQ